MGGADHQKVWIKSDTTLESHHVRKDWHFDDHHLYDRNMEGEDKKAWTARRTSPCLMPQTLSAPEGNGHAEVARQVLSRALVSVRLGANKASI